MIDRSAIILDEIAALVARVRSDELDALHRRIADSPRVFAFATGRSGFVLRGFVMRLNHLGQPAYYVGEASTPPIGPGDLLVVVSGSGTTATTLGVAMEAVKLGASVAGVIGTRLSPLGQLAGCVVELPAPHKRGLNVPGGTNSLQTAGSLFEQAAFIVLESLILRRFQDQGHDAAQALKRHANLEA